MLFQLVRATDDEIVVWQTEHGHIYAFTVCPETDDLRLRMTREAPDATEPAEGFTAEAHRFADTEARQRQLIGRPGKRRRAGCSTEIA